MEQNDRLEDVFYIRTSEIPSDDDNYFSIGCLKQYVIGKNSNTCEPFSSLFQRNKAIHSIVSQSEQPAVLKRTLGPTDLYFCFQSKEQYENSRTKVCHVQHKQFLKVITGTDTPSPKIESYCIILQPCCFI